MAICPYCKDSVIESEAWFCPACDATHHLECWEANEETCSVYGCESRPESRLLGCPFCEEAYPAERKVCMLCNSPLMNSQECSEFVERYKWNTLDLPEDANILLTMGYLRNNGVIARMSKKAPISMFGIHRRSSLMVAEDQTDLAQGLLNELFERFTNCEKCGHVLYLDEENCSFCESI